MIKRKLTRKTRSNLHKYIGETSRSTYKRGWEHCNDLVQLNPESHMLKYYISQHPGQDMAKVRFGMKVIKYCQTSFERQIQESVIIQKEICNHILLNSRTKYNRCSLPRISISTQVGESEFNEYKKEIDQEKQEDARIDKKICELRKEKNKARLHPTKETGPITKKGRTEKNNYVSIQEIWGRPRKPSKNKTRQTHQQKN